MVLNDPKKELLSYIENTNVEELFSLMKEDFVFYGKVRTLILQILLAKNNYTN
jgi:hypothetical protein